MKVLYTGYYAEQSEWGRQTVNNILALDRAGVDVVCRSIKLGGQETPSEIKHLEEKSSHDATHCIQHVFPEHLVGTRKFEKNIALFANSFVDIAESSWVEKLDLMDEIWVPSARTFLNMPTSLQHKSVAMPFAINVDVFNKKYRDLSFPKIAEDFKVYTCVSQQDMTGLAWVISSFHSEFDPLEPVSLVVNVEPAQEHVKAIEDLSARIKKDLRLHADAGDYKRDVIISAPVITQENLFELHQCCDLYVSSNTSGSIPMNEIYAYGFGNTPIVSEHSPVRHYFMGSMHVPSIYQAVQSKGGMWTDANNGKDFWIRPCEKSIRIKMRTAFEEQSKNPIRYKLNNKQTALANLSKFSIEKTGEIMKEHLDV